MSLRKILGLLLLFASVVLTLGGGWLYFNQNKLIALFVAEANRHLQTPVKVGRISLSLFSKFPSVAVRVEDVEITGTLPGDARPLARANALYATLELRHLLSGQAVVSQLYLENAQVLLRVDDRGQANYRILKPGPARPGAGETTAFDLRKIVLTNVNVRYERGLGDHEAYEVLATQADARLRQRGDNLDIALLGDLTTRQLTVDNRAYFKNKSLTLDCQMHYHLATRTLTVQPSRLGIGRGRFVVQGTWVGNDTTRLDVAVRGEQTDVQTLLSLLPEQTTRRLGNYRSQGNVYFNGTVRGNVSGSESPRVTINFGCQDATFTHPASGKRLQRVSLTGTYTNGAAHNLATSSLKLPRVSGVLDGRTFGGSFALVNFAQPTLAVNAQGSLDAGAVLAFAPVERIERASGTVTFRVAFDGKLSDLRADRLTQYVRTAGEISVKGLAFKLRGVNLAFAGISGSFQCQRSDLRVTSLTGRVGNSDLRLTGFFKNALAYALLSGQTLDVEADLQANLLDLDQLLTSQTVAPTPVPSTAPATARKSASYRFDLSPRLSLALQCRVGHLRFRRFRATDLRGQLTLRDQVAHLHDGSLQTAGGSVALEATVDGRQPNRLAVETQLNLTDIAVDSAFYACENFKQTFIQDHHLRGTLTSDIRATCVFDDQLAMLTPLLKADLDVSITDGQLINFAPMRQLSTFLRRRDLANIRFSELTNHLRIENRTVTVPQMRIQSSVADIAVSGTHTFDQVMDYHLRFPLRNLARPDKDTRFGEVAQEDRSGNLFLAIRGTSSNFKIAYDGKQTREKIREDLRAQSPINPLRKKPEKDKKPAEDAYFDFQ